MDAALTRARNSGLGGAFASPLAAVAAHGAIQAQDVPGGLWAVGLRTRGATQETVERAIERREIVRTWPMRSTLHYVAAADVHWLLDLCASRALPRSAGRRRQLGISDTVLARARRVLERALAGGACLARPEVYSVLDAAGVRTAGTRGLHVTAHLAHEGLLCFGPREGKQPTFTLLDSWVPPARRQRPRDPAAELARRYFATHGPATDRDFAWWSGLTLTQARAGIAAMGRALARAGERIAPRRARLAAAAAGVHLLPPWDELTVAYRDREPAVARLPPRKRGVGVVLGPVAVSRGRIVGTWRRAGEGERLAVTVRPLADVTPAERRALARAVERYRIFRGG